MRASPGSRHAVFLGYLPALLESLRPDFWASGRFEVNSFHEAFGDCVAILTALNDKASRQAVLVSVDKRNAIESTAENLAEGIARMAPGHNAGVARPGYWPKDYRSPDLVLIGLDRLDRLRETHVEGGPTVAVEIRSRL